MSKLTFKAEEVSVSDSERVCNFCASTNTGFSIKNEKTGVYLCIDCIEKITNMGNTEFSFE